MGSADRTKAEILETLLHSRIAKDAGTKDRWVEMVNEKFGDNQFNVAKSPYDVWSGKYTQIRPRGATYANPEGIDAAYNKALGMLGENLD